MTWPVMLYVPNLIGYFRVGCMVASFYFAFGCEGGSLSNCDASRADYTLAMFLYFMNFAGDLVDGYAARFMGQSSKFGAVLDMVTDRTSTAGLTTLLAVLYPKESLFFALLMVLDIFSHWYHVVNSEVMAKHHKEEQSSVFLKWYYGCYPLFAYCCVSQEFYYLARWALVYAAPGASIAGLVELKWFCDVVVTPGFYMKQVVNVAQLWNAMGNLADASKIPGTKAA